MEENISRENEKDITQEEVSDTENDNQESSEPVYNKTDEDDEVSEYNDTASQYAELEEKLNEANNVYLRLFAEYDNFRKRTAREKTETYNNAVAKCVENVLPVFDSFERALDAECSDENFKNGMNMIFNQLKDFLSKMNVTEVESLGAEFDPNIHNAIQQQDGTDYASNHVCAVFQKGYRIGDKLIRPAMVAVAV